MRTDAERMAWLRKQPRGAFLRAAIDAAMDAARIGYEPATTLDDLRIGIRHLHQEIRNMSDTFSKQLDDAMAVMDEKLAGLSADAAAIATEITDLQAQIHAAIPDPGTTITQAQIDHMHGLVDSVTGAVDKLDALKAAAATPVAVPPADPAPPAPPADPAPAAPPADPAAPAPDAPTA